MMLKLAAKVRLEYLSLESDQAARACGLDGLEYNRFVQYDVLGKLVRDGFRSELARRQGAMAPISEARLIEC